MIQVIGVVLGGVPASIGSGNFSWRIALYKVARTKGSKSAASKYFWSKVRELRDTGVWTRTAEPRQRPPVPPAVVEEARRVAEAYGLEFRSDVVGGKALTPMEVLSLSLDDS